MNLRRRILTLLLLVIVTLTGCATRDIGTLGERGPLFQNPPEPLSFTAAQMTDSNFISRFDNVQILLDTSASMAVDGYENLITATNFLSSFNDALPNDFSANMGLRIFGDNQKETWDTTELVYGMAPYSHAAIADALQGVNLAGGECPLDDAINAAVADFEQAGGSSALLIVSDGSWNRYDAPAAAKLAKEKLGERLCVFTVWVGNIRGTQVVLDQVVAESACGAAENGANLTEQTGLASFIENTFLDPAPVVETQPAPVEEPAVVESMDILEPVIFTVLFNFNDDKISDEMIPVLDEAKAFIEEKADLTFVLSGHSDTIGVEPFNQELSERRAETVKKWLVLQGIPEDRLEAVGFGETAPIADNDTEEGRMLNRRVDIAPK